MCWHHATPGHRSSCVHPTPRAWQLRGMGAKGAAVTVAHVVKVPFMHVPVCVCACVRVLHNWEGVPWTRCVWRGGWCGGWGGERWEAGRGTIPWTRSPSLAGTSS